MTKIYQPVRGNQYHLPHHVYHQSIWFIRGYNHRREEAEAILEESPPPSDEMPREIKHGDPVATIAGRREKLLAYNSIVDRALETIPADCRDAVYDNIVHGTKWPMIDRAIPVYSHTTWSKYRARTIYAVAEGLELM